jgi:arginase family enzyme
MKETFEYLGDRNPIHISFDIDAYDYSIVTGTGTPSLKILLIK